MQENIWTLISIIASISILLLITIIHIDFLSMPFKLRKTLVTLKFVNANLLHDTNVKSWLTGCCL